LIIGLKNTDISELDIEGINLGTACVSHEFFISRRNSEQENRLAKVLGTKSGMLSDEELKKIVGELITEGFVGFGLRGFVGLRVRLA